MIQASPRTTDHSLRLRAATIDDVAEIASLLDAATMAWVRRPTTADEVRDRLNKPHTTPERDSVVAVDGDDTILGFGHVWPARPEEIRCFGRTHQQHRGEGVGTSIQSFLIARAAEIAAEAAEPDPVSLTATTWPGDADGEAMMAAVGYTPARYYQKMRMDFAERSPSQVADPPGVTLRGFTTDDEAAIFAAFEEAFADHWGEENPDEAEWWHDRRDAEAVNYDPGLWILAMDGDEIAGFVTAVVDHDDAGLAYGYIYDLGVRPGWRGHGLGECLLTRSIELLRGKELPYVLLDVDTENTTGAVRLYTKVGMQPRPSYMIWSRPLS